METTQVEETKELVDRDIASLAEIALKFFEYKTHNDGSEFYCKKEGAPEWVCDLVETAHDNCKVWPNDFTYNTLIESLSHISNNNEDEALESDVYTSDLLNWLSNAPNAVDYCDQAQDEGLVSDKATLSDRISCGQYLFKNEILGIVKSFLEDLDQEKLGLQEEV